jgi:hypothetical protein
MRRRHIRMVFFALSALLVHAGCARNMVPVQTQAECEAEARQLCTMTNVCSFERSVAQCCADAGMCQGNCANASSNYNNCINNSCQLVAQCAMRFRG